MANASIRPRRQRSGGLATLLVAALVAMPVVGAVASTKTLSARHAAIGHRGSVEQGVATRARCDTGSRPERDIQGRVSKTDRHDGRSRRGYSCNLRLVGRYQGTGASFVTASAGRCAYMPSAVTGLASAHGKGVRVIDVRHPHKPRLVEHLTSPAMALDPWESLKVNPRRGLLAGVATGVLVGALFFDVYSIRPDCRRPRLLNGIAGTKLTIPANLLGHEGSWAPDGRTYYASGVAAGSITAIDVSDPRHPHIVFTGVAGFPANHGFSLSADGTRMYVSRTVPGGIDIYDVSSIQHRDPLPYVRYIGGTTWKDGIGGQHTIPFTHGNRSYLVAVDELGAGAIHLVDITDEQHPRVVGRVKLAIQQAKYAQIRRKDTAGNGFFGYEAHYCSLDRSKNPKYLACGMFQSGVRVFDISRLRHPREVAYYNPPAQTAVRKKLTSSVHATLVGSTGLTGSDLFHGGLGGETLPISELLHPADLTTDWCTSPPRFVGRQLWVSCADNGFMVLRFTNGIRP